MVNDIALLGVFVDNHIWQADNREIQHSNVFTSREVSEPDSLDYIYLSFFSLHTCEKRLRQAKKLLAKCKLVPDRSHCLISYSQRGTLPNQLSSLPSLQKSWATKLREKFPGHLSSFSLSYHHLHFPMWALSPRSNYGGLIWAPPPPSVSALFPIEC